MADPYTSPRGRYRPSGRLDLARFAPSAAAVLSLASVCSWLLWLGFEHRFYAPLVFTLGGMMATAGLSLLAVRLGHCRSPAAALGLGLLGGLLLQPGHHLLAYLNDRGPAGLADPAGFVRHLDGRLAATAVEWRLPPRLADDEDAEPSRSDYLFLWGTTALELVLIPLLCALPPLLRVLRNPYCEACGEWAERTRIGFVPAAEDALASALEEGRLAAVAAGVRTELHPNRPALLGLLDVCPFAAQGHVSTASGAIPAAGYLSLRQTTGDATVAIAMEPLFPYHRLRPRCAALSVEEVAALRTLAPERSTATVAPSWVLDALENERPAAGQARIETVEQLHPPPLSETRTRRLAEALNLAPILGCLAAGFGLLWAAAEVEDGAGSLAAVLGFSGFGVMVLGVWVALMDPHLLGDRYLMRRLAHRLAQRADLLVRPGDADAVPVALVPRSAWSGPRPGALIDHGLLAVRDALLYEGDGYRMRIPAASLEGIALEPLVVDQLQTWHFVVLAVRGTDGLHTLPFVRIAAPLGETLLRSKKRRTVKLLQRIEAFAEGKVNDAGPRS